MSQADEVGHNGHNNCYLLSVEDMDNLDYCIPSLCMHHVVLLHRSIYCIHGSRMSQVDEGGHNGHNNCHLVQMYDIHEDALIYSFHCSIWAVGMTKEVLDM